MPRGREDLDHHPALLLGPSASVRPDAPHLNLEGNLGKGADAWKLCVDSSVGGRGGCGQTLGTDAKVKG